MATQSRIGSEVYNYSAPISASHVSASQSVSITDTTYIAIRHSPAQDIETLEVWTGHCCDCALLVAICKFVHALLHFGA